MDTIQGTLMVGGLVASLADAGTPGPWVFEGRGPNGAVSTDAAARSKIFYPHVAEGLFSAASRRHYPFPDDHPALWVGDGARTAVRAVEWVTGQELPLRGERPRPAEFVVHVATDAPSVDLALQHLHQLTRTDAGRETIIELVRSVVPGMRPHEAAPRVFSCLLFPESPAQGDRGLFLAASLTPDVFRHVGAGDVQWAAARKIPLSGDWSVLVLRDGAAFVLERRSDFDAMAATYVRSIYSDVFVWTRLEAATIELLSEAVGTVTDEAADVLALDQAVSQFRSRRYWPRPSRSLVAAQLVDRSREELATVESLQEVVLSTELIRGALDTRLAAAAQASADRAAAALGLLSLVGLPLATALSIWQGLGSPVRGLLWVVVATVVATGVLLALPGARALWTALLTRS